MSKKNKLFSIGEISRYTGASIKSLRYYEELKILKPAFVDPYSSYRYYSFEQCYLIYIIMFCIELDIPLKELCGYINKNEEIDLSTLLAHGKKIAQKKLKVLQKGLGFIEDIEQKIALSDKYHQGQEIYSREIPEKKFYVIPCEQSFDDAGIFELAKPFLDMEYSGEDFYELSEYGCMCEYSPSGIQRYVFFELPEHDEREGTKIIPAGTWLCRQDETSQIEQAPQVFSKHLKSTTSFLVIETEVFIEKYKIYKPVNEMRVIALPPA